MDVEVEATPEELGEIARIGAPADLGGPEGYGATAPASPAANEARTEVLGHWADGPSRDALVAEVETRTQVELMELDAKLVEGTTSLEGKLASQLDGLDAEMARRLSGLDTGGATATAAIEERVRSHDAEIEEAMPELDRSPFENRLDATRAVDDARREAETTLRAAHDEAQVIEAAGASNAALARAVGMHRAAQATERATARAAELRADPDAAPLNAVRVLADGKARAAQAEKEAERAARQIEAKAEAEAKATRERGQKDALAARYRGEASAHRSRERGRRAAASVGEDEKLVDQHLHSRVEEGRERMDRERIELGLASTPVVAGAGGQMATLYTQAKAKAQGAHDDAVAKMTADWTSARDTVMAKRAKDLARIAAAKDEELVGIAHTVRADLKAMNRTSDRVETQMDGEVAGTLAGVAGDVAERKQQVRAEAARAQRVLNRMIAAAKKRIAAADGSTSEAIELTADGGKAQLELAQKLEIELLAHRNQIEREDATPELVDGASEAIRDLAEQAAKVAENIDDQWTWEAIRGAADVLGHGRFNFESDAEQARAHDIIGTLPPELQKRAQGPVDRRNDYEMPLWLYMF